MDHTQDHTRSVIMVVADNRRAILGLGGLSLEKWVERGQVDVCHDCNALGLD